MVLIPLERITSIFLNLISGEGGVSEVKMFRIEIFFKELFFTKLIETYMTFIKRNKQYLEYGRADVRCFC